MLKRQFWRTSEWMFTFILQSGFPSSQFSDVAFLDYFLITGFHYINNNRKSLTASVLVHDVLFTGTYIRVDGTRSF